jgi:hypothetical protein
MSTTRVQLSCGDIFSYIYYNSGEGKGHWHLLNVPRVVVVSTSAFKRSLIIHHMRSLLWGLIKSKNALHVHPSMRLAHLPHNHTTLYSRARPFARQTRTCCWTPTYTLSIGFWVIRIRISFGNSGALWTNKLILFLGIAIFHAAPPTGGKHATRKYQIRLVFWNEPKIECIACLPCTSQRSTNFCGGVICTQTKEGQRWVFTKSMGMCHVGLKWHATRQHQILLVLELG